MFPVSMEQATISHLRANQSFPSRTSTYVAPRHPGPKQKEIIDSTKAKYMNVQYRHYSSRDDVGVTSSVQPNPQRFCYFTHL